MIRKNYLMIFITILIFFLTSGVAAADPLYDIPHLGMYEKELEPGDPFIIKNENGDIISKMARLVYEGDEIIAEDNRHYRVTRIDGKVAYAEYVGEHDINSATIAGMEGFQIAGQGENYRKLIAVYHTHTAESYIPGDGTESKPGKGGIIDIGDVFCRKLEGKGIEVLHSKTSHEPRDANAYKRSRRTAVDLMKKGPAALVDIHRDGISDPDYYNEQIAGLNVTQVRLVVGRQNQNFRSNLDFAKWVKAKVNESYPGLVKEIFIAKGNYNQDLTPRALLLEVGTHTNSKKRAKNGALLFADALPNVLGLAPGGPATAPQNRTDWTTVLWILFAVIVGGGAFLVISSGGFTNAMEKLKKYMSTEWTNFMGGVPDADKDEEEPSPEKRNDERAGYQKD